MKTLTYVGISNLNQQQNPLHRRLFRKTFTDFNLASKTFGKSKGGTLNFMSRRSHISDERYPVDDFESFLYSMCRPAGITLGWINNQTVNRIPNPERAQRIYAMKLNTDDTLVSFELFLNFASVFFSITIFCFTE